MKKFEGRNLKVKCYSRKLWQQVLHLYNYDYINQIFNDKNFFVASMEDENHANKNSSGLFENTRYTKEKSKQGMNESRRNKSMDRKYSERYF